MGPILSAPHASDEGVHSVSMTMNQDGVAPIFIVESEPITILDLPPPRFPPIVHKIGPRTISEKVLQPFHHGISSIQHTRCERDYLTRRGSFDGTRLYPSPSTSALFHQGSMNETPTHDLVSGSPSMRPFHNYLHHSGTTPPTQNDSLLVPLVSRPDLTNSGSVLSSFSVLHLEPSPSTGTRDQGGDSSYLLNLSDERPYPNFSRGSIVDTGPQNPYLPDNDPLSSSESPYSSPVIPMQVAAETDADKPQGVRSPYIFAPSSFPISRGANMVDSNPSVGVTDRLSPFAYNTNLLPMASSGMHLTYGRFQDLGTDYQSPDEPGLEEFWTSTPDALAAHSYEMLNQPSVEFIRQTWWESLTRYYGGPRAHATRRITEDLSHLFRVSNSLLAFFHHPSQREHVQPSLIVAMLALSTLLQSSDIGLGHQGRLKALELRDLAQSHLDTSLNSGMDYSELAQAALLLVVFEASCHPAHSESRSRSTLFLLDSLISGLGLLDLDKEEYNVTTFRPNSCNWSRDHETGLLMFALSALQHVASSKTITPLWLACPGWSEEWSVVETRREEQRRLVWNTLSLTSGFLSYYNSLMSQNLSIAKAWNFKVFLPAEKLYGTPQIQDDLAAKQSIWALYSRCHMLYSSCLSVHHDESISEYDKGQLAVQAWLECERIENMLDGHTCDIEKATPLRALYHLSTADTYRIRTSEILTSTGTRQCYGVGDIVVGMFHDIEPIFQLKSGHQKDVAQQFLGALSRVTGSKENTLATRPYFTFWFHDQLDRYLDIWEQDPTLRIALDLCVQLLPIVECLMNLFPSNRPRQKYEALHQRLVVYTL
ncbi:hypothetical protein BS47DRAFT_1358046 [Hydnum rufescens UP504]|uniref:Transcription factor domain-containing protein n=1 Tax=Hydnum rufescens UP504 TaxID=1448309 RepID=A0A9P6B8U0_9AGAM|nr:hypothetical protein BS47DRAFT_1358046 [Hydnum rufescens UP504]